MVDRPEVSCRDEPIAHQFDEDIRRSSADITEDTLGVIRSLVAEDRKIPRPPVIKKPPKRPQPVKAVASEPEVMLAPVQATLQDTHGTDDEAIEKSRKRRRLRWPRLFRRAAAIQPVVPQRQVTYYDTPSPQRDADGSWHTWTGYDLTHLAEQKPRPRLPRYGALSVLVLWAVYWMWFIY